MNLLTDPLFRVESSAGLVHLDLPGLLHALGEDRVMALPGLQRHQEDAFHVFLCYLAGAVLAREGREAPAQPAEFWREGIRRLTRHDGGEDDSAWTLVVADPTKPAFMQPPVATHGLASKLDPHKPKARTPDELDVLQTAKNHDVKTQRSRTARPEGWVFALVTLQTTTGHMGSGNYGIARMNSGTGNRLVMGLVYTGSPGGRWSDDTRRLLEQRLVLLQGPWHYRDQGTVLTWVRPWDLSSALDLSSLDPFFIEVARAYRLMEIEGRTVALSTGSSGNRIAAKATKGVLGDPWTPLVDGGEKAWTVRPPVFSPKNLCNVLFEAEGFIAPAFSRSTGDWERRSSVLSGSVLAPAGMGKTDGFHAVTIPIPARISRRLFRNGPERDRLASLSRTAIDDSGTMQNRVLKPAVLSLLEAGPDKVDFDKREVSGWWEHTQRDFAADWSADFFPWLWRTVEHPDAEVARLEWLQALHGKAKTALEGAIARYPTRQGRRYRARVRAEGLFRGLLFKQFPQLKEKHHDTAENG